MAANLRHVGVDAILAERQRLLDVYDRAKAQATDDPIKTEHGVVAEAILRDWLATFLPKRFGVTKGYIITTNLEYAGPLEEWDIIVYDALEAPVLFVRDQGDGGGRKRGIPIEHVRAVIEVKAALTHRSATAAKDKLLRLKSFLGCNTEPNYPQFFSAPFVCTAIFFETKVDGLSDYRRALDELSVLLQTSPEIPFAGALILRSQREPSHSGYVQGMVSDEPIVYPDVFELSSPFRYPSGQHGILGCMGFGVNYFAPFVFDLLAAIKGTRTGRASSFYGLDFQNVAASRLFHLTNRGSGERIEKIDSRFMSECKAPTVPGLG